MIHHGIIKKNFLVIVFCLSFLSNGFSQRKMENLDRGFVALDRSSDVLLSWRILGTDPENIGFNIYRDDNKINSSLITGSGNYVDKGGVPNSNYKLGVVLSGNENVGEEIIVFGQNPSIEINLKPRIGYSPNDASVGDVDGDGRYEIIIKRMPNDLPGGFVQHGENVFLEAYTLDGAFLWEVDLGSNINYPVEVQFIVFDFDSDGRAEVAIRTSEGTIFGDGEKIGDVDNDGKTEYAPTKPYYVNSGPEFLSIISGLTGEELARTDYIGLHPLDQWGDDWGHRAHKDLMAVGYFNGVTPSVLVTRGIYNRTKMQAFNFKNNKLESLWTFDSQDYGPTYFGQGNHSLAVGDVDDDGRDEIMFGAMAVDENGKGMYSTGMGHGDATHLGDFDPDRPGLEYFQPHENQTYGVSYRDPATGEIIWEYRHEGDIGRAWVEDVDPKNPGAEFVAIGFPTMDRYGKEIVLNVTPFHAPLFWDGDVQKELRKGDVIDDGTGGRILTAYNFGASKINGTKADACFAADILGDWREEVIWKSFDNTKLLIFITPYETDRKNYTLMHDPLYRNGAAMQNVSYNQEPHLSFFFANGAPKPNIELVIRDEAGLSSSSTVSSSSSTVKNVVADFSFHSQFKNMSDSEIIAVVKSLGLDFALYDMFGKKVYSNFSKAEIDFELLDGVYFLKYLENGSQIIRPLVLF